MSRKSDHEGTFELLARLPQQFIALIKAEYENAKREITERVKKLGIGALAVIAALFFLFFALGALVATAIAALALVWPAWLAALVVAFALILLAIASILVGIWLIKRGVPVPEETLQRVEHDFEALAEVRVNDSAHLAKDEPYLPRNTSGQSTQRGWQ